MKRKASVPRGLILLLGVVLLSAGAVAPAGPAAEPVGVKITAIDAKAGIVTAKEAATGRSFQFQVKDAALLKSLKVGQTISADLKAMTVTLPAAAGAKAVQVRILKAEPVGQAAEGFTQLGPDKLQINDGYVFKRTSPSAGVVGQAAASGGGFKVSCGCAGGSGCTMVITGQTITCNRAGCTEACRVKVKFPGGGSTR